MSIGFIFSGIIIIFSLVIFWINKNRNAWDVLFFNSTLAIVTLFMVGILANNIDVWKIVAGALGFVATGEKIVAFFIKDKK
jgi:hypothetical protein